MEQTRFWQTVRRLDAALAFCVRALAAVSGISICLTILVVCADVVLRLVNLSFIGAYDIVRILGAITLAAALPYTTAVKGHVAIEFLFQILGRKSRIVVDSIMRLLSITLFAFLSWRSIEYGFRLLDAGRVSQTLQIPVFWVPMFIGLNCFFVVLVILHHLVYPQREMIKP